MSGMVVFEVGERLVALDSAAVEKVVETERIFFLPGQRSFVKGVISVNGEAVPVMDAGKILSEEASQGPPHRVIVAKGKAGAAYGIYIGNAKVHFSLEGKPQAGKPERVDWTIYFDEAARLLATRV